MDKKISNNVSEIAITYSNEVNSLGTSDWKVSLNNLFFGLMSYFREKKTKTFVLSFDYINKIAGLPIDSSPRDTSLLLDEFMLKCNGNFRYNHNTKEIELIDLTRNENGLCIDNIDLLTLFSSISYSREKYEATFNVTENIVSNMFLKDKTSQFTKFRFFDFMQIENPYAKTLYRLFSQYKSTGVAFIKIENLKKILGKEKMTSKRFVYEIIKPSIDILNGLNLELYEIDYDTNRDLKSRIQSFEFTFKVKRKDERTNMIIQQYEQQIFLSIDAIKLHFGITDFAETQSILNLDLRGLRREMKKMNFSEKKKQVIESEFNDYKEYTKRRAKLTLN